jgi:hypothetical protein
MRQLGWSSLFTQAGQSVRKSWSLRDTLFTSVRDARLVLEPEDREMHSQYSQKWSPSENQRAFCEYRERILDSTISADKVRFGRDRFDQSVGCGANPSSILGGPTMTSLLSSGVGQGGRVSAGVSTGSPPDLLPSSFAETPITARSSKRLQRLGLGRGNLPGPARTLSKDGKL